jgi:hypothetical protein
MALQPKTFRTNDNIVKALKERANTENISESDIINKALRCYLGVVIEPDCTTYKIELDTLKSRIEKLIKANNLKEV